MEFHGVSMDDPWNSMELHIRASIKPGTWNIPEHPGTSNNYDNYEKNA